MARWIALYLLGIAVLGGWSLSHVLGGTVDRENFALVLILPLAWITSYWPTLGSLLVAWKVHRLSGLLEEVGKRRSTGAPASPEQRAELEDTLVHLAAEENGIPTFIARRVVRRLLAGLGQGGVGGQDALRPDAVGPGSSTGTPPASGATGR